MAAKIKTFLIHCLGRIVLRSAFRTDASAHVVLVTALHTLSSATLVKEPRANDTSLYWRKPGIATL
jgi:hypothetical protein